MKQIMFGMFSGVFVLLCAIAILTVEGRTNRENELKHALSAAMEETMQNLCMTHKYEVESREEFAADFCQALLQKIQVGLEEDRDRHLSLQVNITEADPKKGLLSVAVTENFSHPNGKIGTIQCSSTAILEQEEEKREIVLTYYLGDRIYRQYGLLEGDDFKLPQNPSQEGRAFVCWLDKETGREAAFPEKAAEDKSYIAFFE